MTTKQLDNLRSIALLYGYARYFYPNPYSMEYKDLDWYKFLVYTIEQTKDIENAELLKERLSDVFTPLIPELSFENEMAPQLPEKGGSSFYYREHMGVGFRPVENIYTDSIISRAGIIEGIPMPDSLYHFRLSDSLVAYMPLATRTEFNRKSHEQKRLEKIFRKQKFKLFNQPVIKLLLGSKNKSWALLKDDKFRYADIIARWNVIEHFYPYYEEDGLYKIWSKCLTDAFIAASQIRSEAEYFKVVSSMLGHVRDSHLILNRNAYVGGMAASYLRKYYPPVELSWCGDTVYIASRPDSLAAQISKGDILISVNGKSIDNLILEKKRYHSASTPQAMMQTLTREGLLASFTKDSILEMHIAGSEGAVKEIRLKTDIDYSDYLVMDWDADGSEEYITDKGNGIFYVNLTSRNENASYSGFKEYLPEMQSGKAVILDMRGYPNGGMAEDIMIHFARERLVWGDFRRPYYRFPHQKNVVYLADNDNLMPQVSEEERINIPLYILIDHNAMSYGETLIEIFKRNKVGVLVGSATTGTNGDMTMISLPCFGFTMTAIKDFSGFHGKGIEPDVFIYPNLEAIRSGYDYVLNETIKLILEQ